MDVREMPWWVVLGGGALAVAVVFLVLGALVAAIHNVTDALR